MDESLGKEEKQRKDTEWLIRVVLHFYACTRLLFCDFVNRYLSVSTYIEEVFSLKFGLTKPRSCIYDEIKFFECLEKVDFHFRIVTVMHDWRQT